MREFAILYTRLDQTLKHDEKIQAWLDFFRLAPQEDILWAIDLFRGNRPRRIVQLTTLREWAFQEANLPDWLFESTLEEVGDLAEALALCLPTSDSTSSNSLAFWIDFTTSLPKGDVPAQKDKVCRAWTELGPVERLILNRLLTGTFRTRVSEKLLVKALALHCGMDKNGVAGRLDSDWDPHTHTFEELFTTENPLDAISRPYSFHTPAHMRDNPEALGETHEWSAEWLWKVKGYKL